MDNPTPINISGSVTRWIGNLATGDRGAAEPLWKFVRQRLLQLAKREVGNNRAGYDEEDIANSAFGALCEGLEDHRYQVSSREELWRLLAVIAINKARQSARDENRTKRGGKFDRVDSELGQIPSGELTPETEVVCQAECTRLLALLGKDEVKMVALLKVEGYTNEEIADQLGCTRRAIQRRLALIRDFWTKELQSNS